MCVGIAETFAALPQVPESKSCGHLAPGGRLTVGESVYPPLTGPQIAALLAGETTLFARGEVRYVDAFKRPHFMNFCVKASGDGALDNGAPLASCREGNETDDAI